MTARKPLIPFGKYYLLDRVNIGGMAEVYRAKTYKAGVESVVAIKRILPMISEDEDFVQMFLDEAKISVQLTHPNVCEVFDLGKIGENYFIAMEYIPGRDVRAIYEVCKKKNEPAPIPLICYVVAEMCRGLDYAHRAKDKNKRDLNVIHRDVSPQNTLVTYDGDVKVIDFGIAKAANRAQKTQAGILKGKFGYMSPEQVRGLPLDRRSDVFACGVILHEMLSNERLFVGSSDFSVLEKVRQATVPLPTKRNKRIPPALEKIVLKALARDVEERYQWASDLADDLMGFLEDMDSPYGKRDLSQYMRTTFAEDWEREKQRQAEYAEMKIPKPPPEPAPAAVAPSQMATVLGAPAYVSPSPAPKQSTPKPGPKPLSPRTPTHRPPPPTLGDDGDEENTSLLDDDDEPATKQLSALPEEMRGDFEDDEVRTLPPDGIGAMPVVSGSFARKGPGRTPTGPQLPAVGGRRDETSKPKPAPDGTPKPRVTGEIAKPRVGPKTQTGSGPKAVPTAPPLPEEPEEPTDAGRPTLPAAERSQKKGLSTSLVVGIAAFAVVAGAGGTALLVRDGTGSLVLEYEPKDAAVLLDGARICDSSPCVKSGLKAGFHRLEVVKEGLEPQAFPVEIPKGGTFKRDDVALAAAGARVPIAVACTQADAEIKVDGKVVKELGKPGAFSGEVEVGKEHAIEVSKPGFAPFKKSVAPTAADRLVNELVTLEKLVLTVRFTSTPSGAKVTVDGREVGSTPVSVETLDPAVAHQVVIRKDCHEDAAHTISPGGGAVAVDKQLVKKAGCP